MSNFLVNIDPTFRMSQKNLSLVSFIYVFAAIISITLTAAIPPSFGVVSFADIILLSSSPLIIIFIKRRIFWVLSGLFVWLIFVTMFGSIRGYNTSMITAISLSMKWTGAVAIYLFVISFVKVDPGFKYPITLIQVIVLLSLLTNSRVFPDAFYDGNNGVFQASADGAFYLVSSLGLFIHIYKIYPSKLIALNIFLTSISLILVDSRFGLVLGLSYLLLQLLLLRRGRFFMLSFILLLALLLIFDLISIPSKIQDLFAQLNNVNSLFSADISFLIRINNFQTAFDMSSIVTGFFGNGAKFFQLSSTDFFEANHSLDNSYFYLVLSFGIPIFYFFFRIFLADDGMDMLSRGGLSILPLIFALMQDVFSNSFCLLSLVMLLSFHKFLLYSR